MKRILSLFLICGFLFSLCSCTQNNSHAEPEVPVASEPSAPAVQENVSTEEGEEMEEDVPEPPVEHRVSFFATGDNLIHTGIWRQANRNAGGSGNDCRMDSEYDFELFYRSLAPMVEKADVSFLNQETLVAADESGVPQNYPQFNTPRACGDAMIELGFDVVNLANNHMLDMGGEGLYHSIEYWRSKEGVTQIGAYLDEADYNAVRVVEKNGIRIAFLAYAEDANNSGRGIQTPLSFYHGFSSRSLYVPAMDENELRRQVEAAKAVSDFVVVAFHWGTENSYRVSAVQERYAALCCELGVDVVLGSHPHVLQPIQWLESEDGGTKTLVVYSLGNMISLMESTVGNLLGGALELEFVLCDGVGRIENVSLTPIVSHCSASYREIHVYLLSDYTEELYRAHYIHSHCTTTLSDFATILQAQIPTEFLAEEWKSADTA